MQIGDPSLEISDPKTVSKPVFAGMVHVGILVCAVLLVIAAYHYNNDQFDYRFLLLALGGIVALLITALTIVFWFRGTDAFTRRQPNNPSA